MLCFWFIAHHDTSDEDMSDNESVEREARPRKRQRVSPVQADDMPSHYNEQTLNGNGLIVWHKHSDNCV